MSTVVQQINQSPHKHNNILQQNTNSNQDRNIIVLKKQPHILPQPKGYTKDDILLTNTARKKTKSEKDSSGSKAYPQPIAVARRNARERNRVKQVNNGFANLRQHIPNFIAAAFESNNGRGTNKKLSKVETLRMAVEYIRSLEDVLAMDEVSTSSNEDFGSRSYPSTSPSINGQNMYYSVLSPEEEDDMASVTSTPSPQQFIRINNTYQIIPNGIYENSENMDPLIENHIILNDPSLIDSTLEFSSAQDLYLNSIHTNASLSPGMYSDEQSLSPNNANEKFIPIFVPEPGQPDIKIRLSSDVSGSEDLSVNESNELPVISLKTESDVPDEQKSNVIDVINWWEQQPSTEVS